MFKVDVNYNFNKNMDDREYKKKKKQGLERALKKLRGKTKKYLKEYERSKTFEKPCEERRRHRRRIEKKKKRIAKLKETHGRYWKRFYKEKRY